MKNKKLLAVLVALAVFQLLFPLSFMAYEKASMDAVVEKGTSYSLDYTNISYFTENFITVNTDSIYTVGYVWDRYALEEGYMPHNTISVYGKVLININEKGEAEFFDLEKCDKTLLKKDNVFNTYNVFKVSFDEYEFVREDFGLRELFELSVLLGAENFHELDFEAFTETEGRGIFNSPLEGKVTIKVYNGFAKVTELYLGDELIVKSK